MRVLFITKKRSYPGGGYAGGLSSGLFNSARFVADMLYKNGIVSKTVDVVDNNCIDREVKLFDPTHVFIEALWVVPEKFDVLAKLYPDVKWIVRLHSNTPFASNEGTFTDWTLEYLRHPNVYINVNATEMYETLDFLLKLRLPDDVVNRRLSYLPNFYPVSDDWETPPPWRLDKYLDVGCFGAIRPLKNQLVQAVAALKLAESASKRLRFHINVARVEGRAEPILKNLRNLFAGQRKHRLIEHDWLNHADFVKLVRMMDVGLQMSFSETFNIVAADFADNNVPVVGSDEIPWLSALYTADPNEPDDIVAKARRALQLAPYGVHALNKVGLRRYCRKSEAAWLKFLGH